MVTDKVTSIAKELFIGHRNDKQLAHMRQQLHKKVMLDTGGLPSSNDLKLTIDRPCMITASIDMSDSLTNGAIGHLEFIEYFRHDQHEESSDDDEILEDNTVRRLWLRFPDNCKIGRKIIRLSARYVQRNHISRNLVPIARKNATIYFDKNRTTRNTLRTNQDSILEFLRAKQSASFLISNCQSLRAHNNDPIDAVTQECTFLMLNETWIRNDEHISIPNLDCRVQFKREGVRAGGVAIYQKHNTSHITTPNMDIEYRQTTGLTVTSRPIGDLCAAKCILPNGQKVLSVVVYISPNQHINDIVKFLHFVLLLYTPGGAAVL
ncbi:hypothetical protein QTP88_001867 [Uroleucon formosanum]